MRIALLGPLRVHGPDGPVRLPAAKERSLLAVLALHPGVVVSADALVAALWGERPPATARKTLQTYVSNIRRALGTDSIATEPPGYMLDADPDDVDVVRFRRHVREGEKALRSGATTTARKALAEAVSLWRGQPFADVASHTTLAGERVRLTEEYLSALEARIVADLGDGRHAEIVGEIEMLTREHPYRERLWAQLMLAQYRCGRQADALASYQRARELLADELGLEPGGELRRMEAAVLAQDPSLEATLPAPAESASPSSAFPAPPTPTRSPVRYAVTDDGVNIAYQVVGDGPVDILAVPGFVTHLDIWWDAPTDRLVRRLASLGRLILFDKRGMGLSDRPQAVEPGHWVEDARAVLDAVGSKRAIVFGISAGVPTALMFADRYPSRVEALALFGGYAHFKTAPEPQRSEQLAVFEREWGTGFGIENLGGSRGRDRDALEYWARYQRIAASPLAAVAFLRAVGDADVRDILPSITAPTLILHPEGDMSVPVAAARELADAIPGSRLVELPSDVHLIWLSDVTDQIADEIEAFIKDRPAPPPQRALFTILSFGTSAAAPPSGLACAATRHEGSLTPDGRRLLLPSGPSAAVRCAAELLGAAPGVAIGIHAGECEVDGGDVRGVALDIADRLAALARPGDVLVSQTVRDLLHGADVGLAAWGQVHVDTVPGALDVFSLRGGTAG